MESCKKKIYIYIYIKIYFIFEILQITTLCRLDDSFAHARHSLNQLHLECFSNSLEGDPTYAEHLLADFLHSAVQPIPNHLNLVFGRGIVEARSSDAALHHAPW